MAEFDATALATWIAASLRSATPLLLVMLGETLTQRTGVINLGVEGEMLMGACIGFAAAATTGDPVVGLLAGAFAGVVLSTLHAGLVLGARANQIGSGLAVWIIGLGVTSYYGRAFVGGRVDPLRPLGAHFVDAPAFVRTILDQITPTAPLALALAGLAGLWLYRTRTGLIWRTVGESAEVARALGIRPAWVRLQAILLGGALAGLGGAVLSVDYTQTWAQDITKGKGLVAVGLVIVARWNPYLVIPTALLFGVSETAVLRLQAGGVAISPSLLATMPYLLALMVIVLAQSQAWRAGSMPADLTAIFRNSGTSD
jgi:general nucleoside transport system permease protein